jgi:hypothetical protein
MARNARLCVTLNTRKMACQVAAAFPKSLSNLFCPRLNGTQIYLPSSDRRECPKHRTILILYGFNPVSHNSENVWHLGKANTDVFNHSGKSSVGIGRARERE